MFRTDSGMSLPEVLVAVAISGFFFLAAGRFYSDFAKSQARNEAASNSNQQIEEVIKMLKTRWSQRQRPTDPATDLPGGFTLASPGFSLSPGNLDANRLNLQISKIDAGGNRSSSAMAIYRHCVAYPSLTSRFDYSSAQNKCKCPSGQLNQVAIDATAIGQGVKILPRDPTQAPATSLHSLAICFRWPNGGVTTAKDSRGVGIISDVLVDIEAAYIGARNKIYFLRRSLSLPVNLPSKSNDSLLTP
jgi:prepilin-type N-terminal cleavage/methylation domain-containing protein